MKRMMGVLGGLILVLAPATLRADTQMVSPSGGVVEGRVLVDPSSAWGTTTGNGVTATLGARGGRFSLDYQPSRNWTGATFVVLEMTSRASKPALIWVGAFRGSQAVVSGQMVVMPNRPVHVALPTVSPRQHGMTSWPPMSGATFANLSVFEPAADLSSIAMFRIQNRGTVPVPLEIRSIRRITTSPTVNAMVDALGQIRSASWPGKVTVGSTPHVPDEDEQLTGELPYAADAYGATLSGPTQNTNNRWVVKKVNGRWSLFAPSGRSFFSFGVNEMGAGAHTEYTGREYLFHALPNSAGPHAEHFASTLTSTGQARPGFNQYTYNLELKYGASWSALALERNLMRLKTWGFNTLGANSTVEAQLNQEIPSTLIRLVGGTHRRFSVVGSVKQMHDVYDPRFATSVRNEVSQVIIDRGRHPYHMGIFVDNELPWGQSQDPYYRYAVALSVLRADGTLESKKRFVKLLQSRYRTVQRLNAAWGTSFGSWTSLLNTSWTAPTQLRTALRNDLTTFTIQFANAYFKAVKDALKSVNYTGLYLGCRFAQSEYSPEAVTVARQYVNVLSFNVYAGAPEEDIAPIRSLDFPVLISEVGFPSADQGRTLGYLYPTLSTQDQAEALRLFMRAAGTWTNIVGVHWYNWADLPATGRVWDGNNSSSGLVNIADQPHLDLVSAARAGILELLNARGTP